MARLSERFRLRRPVRTSSPPRQEAREPAAPPVHEEPPATHRGLHRDLPIGELASEEHPVSRLFYGRLEKDKIAEAHRELRDSPDFQAVRRDAADPDLLPMLTLHCAMWNWPDEVAAQTGLRPDQPPEDVHAMARGPLAAAGGLYEADLVVDALQSVGARVAEAGRALDFGCSSGRVVRLLAAAYPDVGWMGCDPNARAVAWACEHLPGIEFFVSGNEPPLALEDGSLTFGFAISIWSHFEPHLGIRWFDEMRRLLTPGGHLVVTAHGFASVGYYAGNGLRTPEQCEEIADALYRDGWWYAPEFGDQGDWGVVNLGWGTSFVSPEWLLASLCPRWRVLEFAPGRNAGNQDVYVLERA